MANASEYEPYKSINEPRASTSHEDRANDDKQQASSNQERQNKRKRINQSQAT
jgi:hypothetical protein